MNTFTRKERGPTNIHYFYRWECRNPQCIIGIWHTSMTKAARGMNELRQDFKHEKLNSFQMKRIRNRLNKKLKCMEM